MDHPLEPLPSPPGGVRYALTVPQSVLFAELSLQGSRIDAFRDALGIAYESPYIAIDNGAMSWICDRDEDFERALGATDSVQLAIERFTSLMERTARRLDILSAELLHAPMRNGK